MQELLQLLGSGRPQTDLYSLPRRLIRREKWLHPPSGSLQYSIKLLGIDFCLSISNGTHDFNLLV